MAKLYEVALAQVPQTPSLLNKFFLIVLRPVITDNVGVTPSYTLVIQLVRGKSWGWFQITCGGTGATRPSSAQRYAIFHVYHVTNR